MVIRLLPFANIILDGEQKLTCQQCLHCAQQIRHMDHYQSSCISPHYFNSTTTSTLATLNMEVNKTFLQVWTSVVHLTHKGSSSLHVHHMSVHKFLYLIFCGTIGSTETKICRNNVCEVLHKNKSSFCHNLGKNMAVMGKSF